MASSRAHTNVTTVNLASQTSKKAQSAQDILKHIESTLPGTSSQQGGLAQQQGGLNARLQGRINEHELAYGDKALPRQGLPKMNNVLLDRYQAARHNVLVLGAIQQAEGKSKSNTHRSHKSGSHTPARGPSRPGTGAGKAAASLAGDQAAAADEAWGDSGSGALSAGPSGIGSDAFGSFKSRGSSKALGSIPEVDRLQAQPSAGVLQLEPEASTASAARSGRRYSRQGSNSSMVSRASASSTVASGLTGVTRASSAGRQLRQQHSHISSGGSSGHTLRSHRGGSVAGSNFGGHHKKGGKRKPPKPEPGRITRCFAEFGSKDDWVSKTVLKHTLASIIQAHWRGYWVRQRWKVNREQLVIDEQARLQAGALHEARLVELQHKLQQYEQKKLAQAAAEAAAAAAGQQEAGGEAAASSGVGGSGAPGPAAAAAAAAAAGAGGGMTSRGVSAAHRRGDGQLAAVASWQSMRSLGEPSYQAEGYAAYGGSDSDTGWSDVELDDVAAIKFRAVTPPWQRAPDRAHMSLALQQRTAAAAAAALGMPVEPADWGAGLAGMGSCWGDDGDDTTAKLQELRHRRICRKPEPVPLSAAAVAAAAAAGLLAAGDTEGGTGAAATTDPYELPVGGNAAAAAAALPQHVVEALLLERYSGKFARLGMPHKMPGRQRWLKMQAEAAAAAAGEEGVLGPNEVPAVVAGVGGAEAPAVAGTDAASADAAPTAAGAAV